MRGYAPPELLVEVHGANGSVNVTEDRLVLHLDHAMAGVGGDESHVYCFSSVNNPVPFLFANPENVLQDIHFIKCAQTVVQTGLGFEVAEKTNLIVGMILEAQGSS